MFVRVLVFLSLFCLWASDPGYADEGSIIGTLAVLEGNATIQGPETDAKPVAAVENTPVKLNDTVTTGKDSRALILLIDETQVALGDEATFKANEYVYDPDKPAENKARYSFPAGAFFYISGLVAKSQSPDVKIETPYGSIGIRGTQVWGGQIEEEYGIYVKEGNVTVETKRGRILVGEGQGTGLYNRQNIPTRPAAWAPEKIDLAVSRIAMKNPDRIKERLAALQPLHKDMIDRYRDYVTNKKGQALPTDKRRYINPENEERRKSIPLPALPQDIPGAAPAKGGLEDKKPVLTGPPAEKKGEIVPVPPPDDFENRRMQKVFTKPRGGL